VDKQLKEKRVFKSFTMNTVKIASTIKFSFDELFIDQDQIKRLMGYDSVSLPEPFAVYFDDVNQCCSELTDICGAYQIFDKVELTSSKKSIFVNDVEFSVGSMIRAELDGSEKLAFFVCTAGATLSKQAVTLLQGKDPVLGYIYDLFGSAIAEAVGDKIQQMIRDKVQLKGMQITNRYSPGYCHWKVVDQHKLFSLFEDNLCGVSLGSSSLMNPVKSISGVIGIGHDVHYRNYQCDLCQMKKCAYKK